MATQNAENIEGVSNPQNSPNIEMSQTGDIVNVLSSENEYKKLFDAATSKIYNAFGDKAKSITVTSKLSNDESYNITLSDKFIKISLGEGEYKQEMIISRYNKKLNNIWSRGYTVYHKNERIKKILNPEIFLSAIQSIIDKSEKPIIIGKSKKYIYTTEII